MNLEDLAILSDVSRVGSFAGVAKDRGVAPSSISRTIANLEADLGVRLFHRTTRKLSLTEAGTAYLARILPLIEELETARLEASDLAEGPAGRLRVTASVSYGEIVLAPQLAAFSKTYPNIEIDLILSDRRVDIIEERIDVALRHGSLDSSSLVARKLCDVAYKLIAHPDYVARAPALNVPNDLTQHQILTFPFEDFRRTWRFGAGPKAVDVEIKPRFTVSNAATLKAMTLQAMGVALLADWTVQREIEAGDLMELLPGWTASGRQTDAAIWLVYPSRTFLPSKSRALIDCLVSKV